MGLKDLFKSRSRHLKPDPRLRWFGKLPAYADYYTSPAAEPWVLEFNDWVLKGYQAYRSRLAEAGKRPPRMPTSVCAVRLAKTEMTVFAVILDYGGDMGGRPFPMCFYVGIPTADWPGPTSDRLAPARRIMRDLLALRREINLFLNAPGALEAVVGHREIDLSGANGETVDRSWMQQGHAILLCDWFEAVKNGLKVQDPQAWFPLLARWGDNIAEMSSKSFEPTLRFPMARQISFGVQLAGWTRWLESRMDLNRRSLSLLVPGDLKQSPGSFAIVARELVPEDFLLLTVSSASLSYIDDIAKLEYSAPKDAGGPPLRDDSAASGTLLGRSWTDFATDGSA